MAAGQVQCGKFAQWLIRKTEHLDEEIIKTIIPTDQLMGMVESGDWASFDGVSHEFDRLERVVPDLTGAWTANTSTGCVGKPCDPDEKLIGFGSTRMNYALEHKTYATDLYCFDLILTADKAREQFEQILFNLKEATIMINSDYLRRKLSDLAGRKWLARSDMATYTYTWNTDLTEITVSALPTSKLLPGHLQRRVQPLLLKGGIGQNAKNSTLLFELLTDMDTLYSMEQGNSTTQQFWRFTQFDESSKMFWELGWAGKIGNFAVKVDLFPVRFMTKEGGGGLVLKRVFPYDTAAATLGIKSEVNDDYIKAPYQWSLIHHRKSMRWLTLNQQQVNSKMPFVTRGMGGQWSWLMNNLGATADGCVINNQWGNKGKFGARFSYSMKPEHTEWEENILHLREPICVADLALCDTTLTSCYDSASVDSANALCTRVFIFTPVVNGSGNYQVLGDTITCNGQTIDNAAIAGAASLAALVTSLNSVAGSLGTWALNPDAPTTQIQLTGNGCLSVNVPFVGP